MTIQYQGRYDHQARIQRFQKAQKRKKLSRFLIKFLLIAGGIFAAFKGWDWYKHKPQPTSTWNPQKTTNIDKKEEEIHNMMLRLYDRRNRLMIIKAEKAVETPHEKLLLYQLQSPKGTMEIKPQSFLNVKSDAGTFNQTAQHLTLSSNVVLKHPDGYVLCSDDMFWDAKNDYASSESYTTGWSHTTAWTGQGFIYDGSKDLIQLDGPATLRIEPERTS